MCTQPQYVLAGSATVRLGVLGRPQVLVETFELGESITNYVDMGPGAPHNNALAVLGSYALLQARPPPNVPLHSRPPHPPVHHACPACRFRPADLPVCQRFLTTVRY